MKMKGFKKLLVSLGLSAVLTLGLPTAAFASTVTGILASVPEGRETSDIPELSTEQVDIFMEFQYSMPDAAPVIQTHPCKNLFGIPHASSPSSVPLSSFSVSSRYISNSSRISMAEQKILTVL